MSEAVSTPYDLVSPWDAWAPPLLRTLTSEAIPLHEERAKLAKDPLWLTRESALYGRTPEDERIYDEETFNEIRIVSTVLRTGGLFVFSGEDAEEAFWSYAESRPEELPPLPFPRMWVEVEPNTRFSYIDPSHDGHHQHAIGWAIVEIEPAKRWGIVIVSFNIDMVKKETYFTPDQLPTMGLTSRTYYLEEKDGQISVGLFYAKDREAFNSQKETPDAYHFSKVAHLPLALVQFAHTLGATWDHIPVHRARRREFARRTGLAYPQLYFVNMRSTGEAHIGNGDREYRHRWLVRGHYRKDKGGTHPHPTKGLCTWVRPYVKGPVGAPWKGRAFYRVNGED